MASKSNASLAIDPLITCRLCLAEYPHSEMYKLKGCQCLFCHMCVKEYLRVTISQGNVLAITCPDAMCSQQGLIESDEIKTLVEKDTFKYYERIKFDKEVELDPPSGILSTSWESAPVRCPKCGFLFCSICQTKWHDNQTCDEFMKHGRTDNIGIPFENEENATIKRCPLCHVPIERNDGCAQMMCQRCNHVFCWYCLASLDDDFLLRHYDKGPCKNKLGHTRASVIWHRTQVVGIFACFGVVLLVASPFLLLAAPCILCCKCKACDDDPEDVIV
ncbi:RBR-type E3 ubiquitin transferase [Lamellibrachia satsuma]|nr:RBR-type E3 ubiquitin transferase [Lamellibrachia satsuma]